MKKKIALVLAAAALAAAAYGGWSWGEDRAPVHSAAMFDGAD